ncbi:hypothetical protein V2J09_023039 [Rumex salicifolius]
MNTPKCSFISWLAVHNRLPTKDRLQSWLQVEDITCVFCNHQLENCPHLFNDCPFISVRQLPLSDWMIWLFNHRNKKQNSFKIKAAMFTSFIYFIWLTRNEVVFNSLTPSVHSCTCRIITYIKCTVSMQ